MVTAYADEIAATVADDGTPVLVELGGVEELSPVLRERCVVVDHHNQYAGVRPSSLRQVFERLGRPESEWSRRLQLIAVNDEGWIPGLLEAGATPDEVRTLRAEERRVLGIPVAYDRLPESMYYDARRAFATIHIDHEYTSAVNDFLHPTLGGPGPRNTLIVTPTKLSFSGHREVVRMLGDRYGGWKGGRLPAQGFFGQHRTAISATPETIATLVLEQLQRSTVESDH